MSFEFGEKFGRKSQSLRNDKIIGGDNIIGRGNSVGIGNSSSVGLFRAKTRTRAGRASATRRFLLGVVAGLTMRDRMLTPTRLGMVNMPEIVLSGTTTKADFANLSRSPVFDAIGGRGLEFPFTTLEIAKQRESIGTSSIGIFVSEKSSLKLLTV